MISGAEDMVEGDGGKGEEIEGESEGESEEERRERRGGVLILEMEGASAMVWRKA